MKILARFVLSSILLFLPAVSYAQNDFRLDKDCGFAPAMRVYTVEARVWIDNKLIQEVSPQIVEKLEDGQNCLNENLIELKASVKSLQSPPIKNVDLATDILLMQDKLKHAELDLRTAKSKMEALEDRLRTTEEAIQLLQLRSWTPARPGSDPKTTASKRKNPVNQPTQQAKPQGNPWDKPATSAIKPKVPDSNPEAPVNKPTLQ